MLQYIQLLRATGITGLPLATHAGVWSILVKMIFVHILNSVHAFCMLVVPLLLACSVLRWFLSGGFSALMNDAAKHSVAELLRIYFGVDMSSWSATWLFAIFGPVPPLGFMMTVAAFVVIRDCMSGRLSPCMDDLPEEDEKMGAASKPTPISWKRGLEIFLQLQTDMWLAEPTIVFYGLIPVVMAMWSLIRNGSQFEYIVAAKPN